MEKPSEPTDPSTTPVKGDYNQRLRDMNAALLVSSAHQHELAEEAQNIADARATLAAIVDSSDDAIISKTLEGVITSWNRAAERMFGWTAAEAIGQSIFMIVPAHLQEQERQVLARLRRDEVVSHFETERQTKDGHRITLSLTISPIRDATGRIIGASKVARDISAQKRLEREREELLRAAQTARAEADAANRAKDVFLATLSHELRTPLNAMMGWIGIMNAKGATEEDKREGLEVIDRNCRMQAQLIEDVLDVSRIVSGKLQLEITRCDLRQVIAAALDVVRPSAEARNIALHTQMDPESAATSCDAHRIQQVVWNLLSNAIKFTPPGGVVSISLSHEGSSARIAVSDNGRGIEPEFLPYVFERFSQGDGSSRRKYGGLGLGLSIVKHLVELHGGTMEATSAGEGCGATFTVWLPVRAIHEQTAGEEEAARDHGKTIRPVVKTSEAPIRLDGLGVMVVMVVEDDADARRLIIKVLQQAGANVTAAESAREALAMLHRANPRVLLSDLGMPGMDGFDLIRAIRKGGRDAGRLPAIALSAFARQEDAERALAAGFQVHVGKPVDLRRLLEAIADVTAW